MHTAERDLQIHRFGEVPGLSLEMLARDLGGAYRLHAVAGRPVEVPETAFDAVRGQYPTAAFLKTLAAMNTREVSPDKNATVRLGITDQDLFVPRLNFVFGEADPDAGVAVISTRRLRPEFYNQGPDLERFRRRLLKEAVHELGHVFGLSHCDGRLCIMHFSNSVEDTDQKGPGFCRECQMRLAMRGLGHEV